MMNVIVEPAINEVIDPMVIFLLKLYLQKYLNFWFWFYNVENDAKT